MAHRLSSAKEDAIYDAFNSLLNPNEVQKISFDARATAGTFTIQLDAETTAAIAYDATAAQIKTALELLAGINEVSVSANMPSLNICIEFTGADASTTFTNVIVDVSALTGVTSATVTKLITGSDNISIDWGFSEYERPDLPLCVLNVFSVRKENDPAKSYKEEDIYTTHTKTSFTLTATIIAEDKYMEYMESIERIPNNLKAYNYLYDEGVAIRSISPSRDLSELLDTKWENRAEIDFSMAYGEDVDELVGEIHKVTADGTMTSDQGNTIVEVIEQDINS